MRDLENGGKKPPQLLMMKVPHIIPHKERIVLFRRNVNNEKTILGLTESACASPQSTSITVHRSRIVEDGYQQLALIPVQALKGVIRVKFINIQNLSEAGIGIKLILKIVILLNCKIIFRSRWSIQRVSGGNN